MAQTSKGLDYLNIINGSIQTKTYTFAIFTLIVVVVLLVGAIRPTFVKITQINKEVKLKRITNTELETKLNNIAKLNNEYNTKATQIDALPLIFPAGGNYSLIMANIEEVAKKNGFNLVGINFGSADKITLGTSVLKPWSARLTVKGSRANFVKFLAQLEEMPMFPRITKVSFSNTVDEDGQTPYAVELLLYRIEETNFYQ